MKTQDFDRLSAYIDDQLPAPEKAALEQRLAREPQLQAALRDLRLTVAAVRSLPQVKPPRSFVLTPAQAGLPARGRAPRRGSLFGSLRLAASLSALALVMVIGGDLAATGGLLGNAAPAPDTLFTTTERGTENTVMQEEAAAVTDAVEADPEAEAQISSLAVTEATPAGAAGGGVGEDAPPSTTPALEAAMAPAAETTSTPEPAGLPAATEVAALVPDADGAATDTQSTKVLPPADATPSADETLTTLYAADAPAAAPVPGPSPLRVVEVALAMLTVLLGLGAWLASRNP